MINNLIILCIKLSLYNPLHGFLLPTGDKKSLGPVCTQGQVTHRHRHLEAGVWETISVLEYELDLVTCF